VEQEPLFPQAEVEAEVEVEVEVEVEAEYHQVAEVAVEAEEAPLEDPHTPMED